MAGVGFHLRECVRHGGFGRQPRRSIERGDGLEVRQLQPRAAEEGQATLLLAGQHSTWQSTDAGQRRGEA
eukprot:2720878-Pyramimonas_sp.AAC.1